jgi:hypothetical protein
MDPNPEQRQSAAGLVRVDPVTNKRWSVEDFACWGALLGVMLGFGHCALHLLKGEYPDGNPLLRVLFWAAAGTVAGTSLLAGLAWLHNRIAGVGQSSV